MAEEWLFLTKPEYWVGPIVAGLIVNLLTPILNTHLPRWIKRAGFVSAVLVLYAVSIVVGAGTLAILEYGSVHLITTGMIAQWAFVGAAPVLLVMMREGRVQRFLLAMGAGTVWALTVYAILMSPAATSAAAKLWLYLIISLLLSAAFVVAEFVGTVWWMIQEEWRGR